MPKNYYSAQINLAQDYVISHLQEEIKLETLSKVAGFSPFHFHRIFKDEVGETVNQFVVRQRLERAFSLMQKNHTTTLTEAALTSGFRSASDFSRNFKRHFGVSPKQWDRNSHLEFSKIRQVETGLPHYTLSELKAMGSANNFQVRVEAFPETYLAYIRVRNSYVNHEKILQAFTTLWAWAEKNQIRGNIIGMSQDDPDVTPASQCRYDVCIPLPAKKIKRQENSDLNYRVIPACTIATLPVTGNIAIVDKAWQYLMRYWLPHSGKFPENLPAMEIYKQSPLVIGWEIFDIECAVPILS